MATQKKKTSTKKSPQKNSANGKMYIEKSRKENANRQVIAIILFAVAIFVLCVTLIPGGNLWAILQNLFFGLFGIGAYIWPFVLIYLAVMMSLDKAFGDAEVSVFLTGILIMMICGAVHVFENVEGVDCWSAFIKGIGDAYQLGKDSGNGGAFGAIIGGVLLWMFGAKVPACITIVILCFVFFMLLSGTTLIGFFDEMKKPVKKGGKIVADSYETSKRKREEYIQQKELEKEQQKKFNPDVNLGPEFVSDGEKVEELPEKKLRKKKKAEPEIDVDIDTPIKDVDFTTTEEKPSVLLDDIIKKASKKQEEPKEEEPEEPTLAAHDETEEFAYTFPKYDLLSAPKLNLNSDGEAEMKDNAEKLIDVLRSFGVETTLVDICRGPSVTRYELAPAQGVRISKITGLADDIALSLAATSIRIEAPIPGKAAVGIEIPNTGRDAITLREILESKEYKDQVKKSKLTVALGRGITGEICTMDISKMPHILVAGTTGSGKSVCMNGMILSLLYNCTPDEVKLVMIDPKAVELTGYNGIPHMLIPVVSDPKKASGALAWAVKEMLNRYKSFSENNVRDIKGYNELSAMDPDKNPMPHIVIFIDEFADLMMAAAKDVEDSVCRLAQMARAAGMHLVIATQSPRVDVITGLIKANIPSRLALKVSNGTDSRIILDMMGAEKLLGNGDMLFNPVGASNPIRIQGCYVPDNEIANVIDFVKSQGDANYNESVLEDIDKHAAAAEGGKKSNIDAPAGEDDGDALLPQAIEAVVTAGQASTTLIQRKLKVGYARAARIIDELEERGIVGPFEGSKPRQVLITKTQWLEMNALAQDDTVPEEID